MKILVSIISILFWASLAFGGQIKIAWDANTESDLAGYKVYHGTSSGIYGPPLAAGNVVTYTVENLTDGQTYFLAVTAYDSSGNESGFSNEVSGLPSPSVTPGCPGGPYKFYVSGGANGWIQFSPNCYDVGPGGYALGQTIKLTAHAYSSGMRFDRWSGDVTGTSNPTTYTFIGDNPTKVFIANFVPMAIDQPPLAPTNFRVVVE